MTSQPMLQNLTMSNKTLAISAAILAVALSVILTIETSWLLNLWKGE